MSLAINKQKSPQPLNPTHSMPSLLEVWEGLIPSRMRSMIKKYETDLKTSFPFEIGQDEKHYYFYLEMPGVKKEDIEINMEGHILNVKAKRTVFADKSRSEEQFESSFLVSEDADTESIQAKYEHGILAITFDKIAPKNAKKIEVK